MTSPTSDYEAKRDEIVLEAVHRGTMLEGHKAIYASDFPELQEAIDSLIQQERLRSKIEDLKNLVIYEDGVFFAINIDDPYARTMSIDERIADLQKQLDELEKK